MNEKNLKLINFTRISLRQLVDCLNDNSIPFESRIDQYAFKLDQVLPTLNMLDRYYPNLSEFVSNISLYISLINDLRGINFSKNKALFIKYVELFENECAKI